jgi:hypothetical protein
MELAPLIHRFAQALRLALPNIEAAAVRSFVIGRGMRERRKAAFYLPNQLERVVASHEEASLALQIARISEVEVEHAPTLAHVIQDARILHGCVYARRARLVLAETRPPLVGPNALHELDVGALCVSYTGNRYFGHWMKDDTTLNLVAREFGPPIATAQKPWIHQAGWEAVLQLGAQPLATARVRELFVFQDIGQNEHRRRRYQILRDRVAAYGPKTSAPGVFVRQGKSATPRGWLDPERTEERLARRGFAIVEPETMTVDELHKVINGAPVIVGLEGSSMSPSILTVRDGGAIVNLQSPFRFNNLYKDYTDALGLRYGFVVGTPQESSFTIDPDDVERTLDLLEPARARAFEPQVSAA